MNPHQPQPPGRPVPRNVVRQAPGNWPVPPSPPTSGNEQVKRLPVWLITATLAAAVSLGIIGLVLGCIAISDDGITTTASANDHRDQATIDSQACATASSARRVLNGSSVIAFDKNAAQTDKSVAASNMHFAVFTVQSQIPGTSKEVSGALSDWVNQAHKYIDAFSVSMSDQAPALKAAQEKMLKACNLPAE